VLPDATNENSCALVFLQFGLEAAVGGDDGTAARLSGAEHACLELLAHLAAPSFFQKLRTEEQLGYLVSAHASRFNGALGLTLLVQSSTAAPRALEERMAAWCHTFAGELDALTPEACATNARALAAQYLERPRALGDAHDGALGELLSRRYAFGRRAARAAAVLQLTQAELAAAWRKRLAPSAPLRRPLRVHMYAHAHAAEAGFAAEEAVSGGGSGSGAELGTLAAVRAFKAGLPRLASPAKHCGAGD
jgi:insulysin